MQLNQLSGHLVLSNRDFWPLFAKSIALAPPTSPSASQALLKRRWSRDYQQTCSLNHFQQYWNAVIWPRYLEHGSSVPPVSVLSIKLPFLCSHSIRITVLLFCSSSFSSLLNIFRRMLLFSAQTYRMRRHFNERCSIWRKTEYFLSVLSVLFCFAKRLGSTLNYLYLVNEKFPVFASSFACEKYAFFICECERTEKDRRSR